MEVLGQAVSSTLASCSLFQHTGQKESHRTGQVLLLACFDPYGSTSLHTAEEEHSVPSECSVLSPNCKVPVTPRGSLPLSPLPAPLLWPHCPPPTWCLTLSLLRTGASSDCPSQSTPVPPEFLGISALLHLFPICMQFLLLAAIITSVSSLTLWERQEDQDFTFVH